MLWTAEAVVYSIALAIRLLLGLAPGCSSYLGTRIELSTPTSSFKRLLEGAHLYISGVNPYDGGLFIQTPLLLLPASILQVGGTGQDILLAVAFAAADLVSSHSLLRIVKSGAAGKSKYWSSPRRKSALNGLLLAAGYLLNPITVLSCIVRNTDVFTQCCILLAVSKASQGKVAPACVSLATATYLAIYPVLLLPAVVLLSISMSPAESPHGPEVTVRPSRTLAFRSTSRTIVGVAAKGLCSFLAAFWSLQYASTLLLGRSGDYLSASYQSRMLFSDLAPNIGLWWYFLTEIFDSFRAFFLVCFWLHLLVYGIILSVRLYRQPLAIIVSLLGLVAVFKPYPSSGDVALYLSMTALFAHTADLPRYTFISRSALAYSICLGPVFYHLWMQAGSGNANFFYAITLVWSLAVALSVTDLIFACMRDEWDAKNPHLRGKAVKQA